VASPTLEGGQVAILRLYARSGCSILLYRGGRITQMSYLLLDYLTPVFESSKGTSQNNPSETVRKGCVG
jgi:hypothetical protein